VARLVAVSLTVDIDHTDDACPLGGPHAGALPERETRGHGAYDRPVAGAAAAAAIVVPGGRTEPAPAAWRRAAGPR
jgi:hypothetical protein